MNLLSKRKKNVVKTENDIVAHKIRAWFWNPKPYIFCLEYTPIF